MYFVILFRYLFVVIAVIGLLQVSQAQNLFSNSVDDHFWRQRVVFRIDLQEKVNKPLIQSIYDEERFLNPYHRGIIDAIVRGFYETKYTGFFPDTLDKPMTFQYFKNNVIELQQSITGTQENQQNIRYINNSVADDELDTEENFDDEELETTKAFENTTLDSSMSINLEFSNFEDFYQAAYRLKGFDFAVDFVEDIIFDARYSTNARIRKYLFLLWIDPQGVLRERYIAAFRFEDIEGVLNQAVWINRFNEAERRTIKEVWDLRIFNYYMLNLSGTDILNLDFSKKYNEKIIELEHNLWEYN